MNTSVRIERVGIESFPIETVELNVNPTRVIDFTRLSNSALISIFLTIALGFGGILTLAWAGVLLWLAGYLIGF
jgi:hypothetical protein